MEDTLRLPALLEPLRPDLEAVAGLLRRALDSVAEPLGSALRGALGGGKHLRPALVILVGRLLEAPAEPFHTLAAAVEMLHTATLIHDDLVDGTSLRRGRSTLHVTWPPQAAVLAGDYLLAQSAALIADLGHPDILKRFAGAICAMSAGEIQQIFDLQERRHDRESYYRHIGAKTASLCAAATEMAGVLAGADEPQVEALRRFGWELGIAFQIADDALDLTGDEARLGKPPGSDLRQGLATLPALLYLEGAEDDVAVRAVLAGQRDAEHVQAAIAAIQASGAVEDALAKAQAHARQARQALRVWPDSEARRTLLALADYVVERTR